MSYKRKIEDQKRLKKLADDNIHYISGAYFDEDWGCYRKYRSYHNEWSKTYARRYVRRKLKKADFGEKGNSYKKIYDYWWSIL